jgi:multidrug efflux pump subunit AcrA (membrane-fusion protein)
LRADQAVRAQFLWRTSNGLTVPTKATMQVGGKYFVFVAQEQNGKLVAHQVEIEVGDIEGDSYQVKSGLKSHDRVVTTGIQRLADGAPIADKNTMEKSETTAQSSQTTH